MLKRNTLYAFASLLFFTLLWEFSGNLLIPPPSKVIPSLFTDTTVLLKHTTATFKEMVAGMAIATACAFPIAWGMLRFTSIKSVLEPFFVIVQCVPMFTLAPIFVLWCGWSFSAVVIPTALMIVFPLTMNIFKGISATPQPYLEYFKVHGATAWQEFFKLRIPFARPHIFAGLRISAAVAGTGAIAGEWAGAQEGLGVYIQICRRNFDLVGVFAALFCLLVLSL
ncbi:MAG: ABC transporter permease, partial [Simkaniaceae bacterium]|nr:ABC transporter permease [Simkaniaceae bacterium]